MESGRDIKIAKRETQLLCTPMDACAGAACAGVPPHEFDKRVKEVSVYEATGF